MRYGVLDLGSTSFQLLVADAFADGRLTPIMREREILNLGIVLVDHGKIPERSLVKACDTVRAFRDLAMRAGADELIPIATSALREARNRPEIAERLSEAAGVAVRFPDGNEEARLTITGVRAGVALASGPTLTLDLGGGSLEVALEEAAGVRWTQSLLLGAGRLTAEIVRHDPPTKSEARALRRVTDDALAVIVARLGDDPPAQVVASGGVAGALARLIASERWDPLPPSLNQMSLPVEALEDVSDTLLSLDLEGRLQLPGIDERRAHLLPAGSVVLLAAARMVNADVLLVSEWGLREGAVLEAVGASGNRRPLPAEIRDASIARLETIWRTETEHAGLVADLAGRLFDGTQPVHGLDAGDRDLLVYAARLHDIGVHISPDRHHKHGAYLVEHADLRGFPPDEVALLASVVRFQRGGAPKSAYPPFRGLEADERERCAILVGVLRVAHALGRGQIDERRDIAFEMRSKRIEIGVGGADALRGLIAEAQERSELLARSIGREIEVVAGDAEAASA